jgi:uncharacterized protein
MLNAKRIFFIILSNVGVRLFGLGIYSTSNSQNASALRVFEHADAQKHPSTNGHAATLIKRERTTRLRATLRRGRRIPRITREALLERKSSVGATLLYGVRRLGAAFGKLTTNRPAYAQGYGAADTNRHQLGSSIRKPGRQTRRGENRGNGTTEIEGKGRRGDRLNRATSEFQMMNETHGFPRSYWQDRLQSLNVGTMKLVREDILARLRAGLPALKRQFPLHGLSLFGSVVRGEAFAESDIDVIADVDPSIGLDFVTLADKLEELTGHKIDLVSRRAIKPLLWKQIERELIDV